MNCRSCSIVWSVLGTCIASGVANASLAEVEATLIALSRPMQAEQVEPYRYGLILTTWSVEKVVTGKVDGTRIAVAQWSWIDGVARVHWPAIGTRATLKVVAWDERPDVHALAMSNDIEDSQAYAWYLDVGDPNCPKRSTALSKARPFVAIPQSVRALALAPPLASETADRARSLADTKAAIEAELARNGGTWEAWNANLAEFRRWITLVHEKQRYEPSGPFCFGAPGILALTLPTFEGSAPGANPVVMISALHAQLSQRGVDLVVVVIPNKEDIYPDRLTHAAPRSREVAVASKRLLAHLVDQGVEVVDLFAEFNACRSRGEEIYQPYDSHWNPLGVRRAALAIAARLQRYAFVREAQSAPPHWRTVEGTIPGGTDLIVGRRKVELAARFRTTYVGCRTARDEPYADAPDSPVLVSGDSFSRYLDLEGGSLTAHLAEALNLSCSLMARQGSGATVMKMLEERGAAYLVGRRVLVYTCVARTFARGEFPVVDLPR